MKAINRQYFLSNGPRNDRIDYYRWTSIMGGFEETPVLGREEWWRRLDVTQKTNSCLELMFFAGSLMFPPSMWWLANHFEDVWTLRDVQMNHEFSGQRDNCLHCRLNGSYIYLPIAEAATLRGLNTLLMGRNGENFVIYDLWYVCMGARDRCSFIIISAEKKKTKD